MILDARKKNSHMQKNAKPWTIKENVCVCVCVCVCVRERERERERERLWEREKERFYRQGT